MLPFLYNDRSIGPLVAADPQTAPIPDLHKAMFAWAEKFTRRSWEMTRKDMQPLFDHGVDERTIADWAQVASMQTWWVMMADGGGVALDGETETGIGVQHKRDWYEEKEAGLLAGTPGQAAAENSSRAVGANRVSWLATNVDSEEFKSAAALMEQRYGFAPNLIRACSVAPAYLERHLSAFELLERPQSVSLPPRLHALVRSTVSSLNRSPYSTSTLKGMFERLGEPKSLYEQATGAWDADRWDERERTVLQFTIKATRNAYKITSNDAEGIRRVGFDDETYVDLINTIAIQSSIDRLTNALGVQPDDRPILPRD